MIPRLLVIAILSPVLVCICNAADPAQSVFKLLVKSANAPSEFIEGTAFAVAADGEPSNPYLYLLTSAHNFFTPEDRESDPISTENIKEVKVQYANNAFWVVNLADIHLPNRWNSDNKDVAIILIRSARKRIDPLTVSYAIPVNPSSKTFAAYGYPAPSRDDNALQMSFDLPPKATLRGTADLIGSGCQGQKLQVQGKYARGMSGGPVIYEDKVIALISDRGSAEDFRCVQTLNIVRDWISSSLPNYDRVAMKDCRNFCEVGSKDLRREGSYNRICKLAFEDLEGCTEREVVYQLPNDWPIAGYLHVFTSLLNNRAIELDNHVDISRSPSSRASDEMVPMFDSQANGRISQLNVSCELELNGLDEQMKDFTVILKSCSSSNLR